MSEVMELLRFGLFDQQVCVPKGLSDEELEQELPRHVATGLSGEANDWRVVRRDDVRVQCDDHADHEHVILACGGFAQPQEPPQEGE